MKNILRKFHKSSNHDAERSAGETSTAAPSAPSPSCESGHRNAAVAVSSPTSPSPAPSPSVTERRDYFSSEEEYQIQLAMAISASNSEFGEDPDIVQIRAATLLSLGKSVLAGEEEGTAESLSRRYWDYNVVDYDEKVLDGFYDIYGLSTSSASHGKIPSLVDLQMSIGDLGFEVIIVNRAIDAALVELEQIAHCISLDIPASEVGFMVQRISELVAQHMGGPVRDAHDMLARWMEKSTELRSSQQTSLLPIGCVQIGLSRHRSLLFKVLADKVGIPCRLVKGSHYTGIDDDAVSIIKFSDGREFLVDLMAAPGTLLPADVLHAKDVVLDSFSATVSQNLLPWAENNSGDDLLSLEPPVGEMKGGSRTCAYDYKWSRHEKPLLLPKFPITHNGSSTSIGSSSSRNIDGVSSDGQLNRFSATMTATSSNHKEVSESGLDNLMSQTHNMVPRMEDNTNTRDLFKELNPFQAIGVGKPSGQFKGAGNINVEYQKHRENSVSGPGRSSLPLVLKNRSPCNVFPNTRQNNYAEAHIPRNHVGTESVSTSSRTSNSAEKGSSESSNIMFSSVSDSPCSVGAGTAVYEIHHTESSCAKGTNNQHELNRSHANVTVTPNLSPIQSGGNNVPEKRMMHEPKEHGQNINGKHRREKGMHDRFMGLSTVSEDQDSSSETRPNKLDPMLDDVAKWEIPWEHLIIGERIGLGSYGEVYRADCNGKEVAVKKFLDQDFYGDALDEFRSEVRIMRRLRHPNVVLFMGAVTRPPNLSIVSEFLPSFKLADTSKLHAVIHLTKSYDSSGFSIDPESLGPHGTEKTV